MVSTRTSHSVVLVVHFQLLAPLQPVQLHLVQIWEIKHIHFELFWLFLFAWRGWVSIWFKQFDVGLFLLAYFELIWALTLRQQLSHHFFSKSILLIFLIRCFLLLVFLLLLFLLLLFLFFLLSLVCHSSSEWYPELAWLIALLLICLFNQIFSLCSSPLDWLKFGLFYVLLGLLYQLLKSFLFIWGFASFPDLRTVHLISLNQVLFWYRNSIIRECWGKEMLLSRCIKFKLSLLAQWTLKQESV